MKVVTFGCQSKVFVYTEKSNRKPVYPYKIHDSVDSAKSYLEDRGIKNIKVIER